MAEEGEDKDALRGKAEGQIEIGVILDPKETVAGVTRRHVHRPYFLDEAPLSFAFQSKDRHPPSGVHSPIYPQVPMG